MKIISADRETVFSVSFLGGVAMLYQNIPEALLFKVGENDPYRESKLFQIAFWYYAYQRLWQKEINSGMNDFLVQVLSSEDYWEEVDDLHKVKLDGQMVAMKLTEDLSSSLITNEERFYIACWYCLERNISDLFKICEEQNFNLGNGNTKDHLVTFWLKFISNDISQLSLDECKVGLECALAMKQVTAVEFFSDKIKLLSKDKLSVQWKDRLFMKAAVFATGKDYDDYPKIFEFCFSQIHHGKYSELLKEDFAQNDYYGSLHALHDALCFDQCQKLFDYLEPKSVSNSDYAIWLEWVVQGYPKMYKDAGKRLFMSMWEREGFDDHRASVVREESNDCFSSFDTGLLGGLVKEDLMEPVWAILGEVDSDQIERFMSSKQAKYICSVLKDSSGSLEKFLSYGKPSCAIQNPSSSNVELKKY